MSEIKLKNLAAWSAVEILTVNEAALLWAGIDPAFCDSLRHAAQHYPPEQYQVAYITHKAIVSGICTGSLPANEIWCCEHGDINGYSYLHEDKQLPRTADVAPSETTINMRALISWAEKKNVLTMRQRLKQEYDVPPIRRVQAENHKSKSNEILELTYQSKHENPPLEVLQEISREIWDQIDQGGKPPKQLIIHDLIKEKYKERTGGEPSANMIKQIDAIARPPSFKNQKS